MFGYPIENTLRYWGARAIYDNNGRSEPGFGLLPDRQTTDGEITQTFMDWVNKRALPWLREQIKSRYISTSSDEVLELREFKFYLVASPRASYGYLYIGAGEFPVVELAPRYNDAAKKDERVLECNGRKFVWGAAWDIPEIGVQGKVATNGIGTGEVVGYHEEKYGKEGDDLNLLSLRVHLDKPPKWWLDQTFNREKEKAAQAGNKKFYKKNWTPPPAIVWDGSFKPEGVTA